MVAVKPAASQHLARYADIEKTRLQGDQYRQCRKQHRRQRVQETGEVRDHALVSGIGGFRRQAGALQQIVVSLQRIFAQKGDHQDTEEQAEQDRKDRDHIMLPFLVPDGL